MTFVDPYDVVPYDVGSDFRVAPGPMAVASWAHGGPRPRFTNRRVLDVGCAVGGNLLPMAFYDPGGHYVGIDTSSRQIEAASRAVAELGLRNVTLHQADLRDAVLDGPFDFVLAHAFLSWVRPEARVALLELGARALAEDGLLFLSYNVFPGWKIRGAVREMLLYAVRDIEAPDRRAARAQKVARTLGEVVARNGEGTYHQLLRRELELVSKSTPSYVLHEHLEPVNDAFFFRDVVALAGRYGLAYVVDVRFNQPEGRRPVDLLDQLRADGLDGADLEQAADFFVHRQFRASVFCRSDARREAKPTEADLAELHVASHLAPQTPFLRLEEGAFEIFSDPSGEEFDVVDAGIKAALIPLARAWPRSIPAPELMGQATALLVEADCAEDYAPADWFERFWGLYQLGFVELRLHEPQLARETTGTPHRLALWEARNRPHLTTPFHTAFFLDDATRSHISAPTVPKRTLRNLARWGLLEVVESSIGRT